jgi:hypothetical protein
MSESNLLRSYQPDSLEALHPSRNTELSKYFLPIQSTEKDQNLRTLVEALQKQLFLKSKEVEELKLVNQVLEKEYDERL